MMGEGVALGVKAKLSGDLVEHLAKQRRSRRAVAPEKGRQQHRRASAGRRERAMVRVGNKRARHPWSGAGRVYCHRRV